MAASIPTLAQHINYIAARVQAVVAKLDELSIRVDGMQLAGLNQGGASKDDLAAMREDVKRDIVRERAMMEASLEHRIDQQVARQMIDRDPSAAISRLEKKTGDIDAAVLQLDARLADIATRIETRSTADSSTSM